MVRYISCCDGNGAVHLASQSLDKVVRVRVRLQRLDSKHVLLEFQLLGQQSSSHDECASVCRPDFDERLTPHADLAARKAGPRKKRGAK